MHPNLIAIRLGSYCVYHLWYSPTRPVEKLFATSRIGSYALSFRPSILLHGL